MPHDLDSQKHLLENYRRLFRTYGDSPEAVQLSAEGQLFRFEKLAEVAPLGGRSVLDIGCGLGHLYPFLVNKFGQLDYTGVDVVPETIAYASAKYPQAHFYCLDLLRTPLSQKFEYVFISGVFNNARTDATAFLRELLSTAFSYCTAGLAFNFISKHVNFRDPDMAYHDPLEVLKYCIEQLTPRIKLHHHYERCDVAVFAYR